MLSCDTLIINNNQFQPQHWEKTKTFTDADNFLPLPWNAILIIGQNRTLQNQLKQ